MTDEVLIEIRDDARLTATEFVAIAKQRSSDVLGTLKNLRADSSFVSPRSTRACGAISAPSRPCAAVWRPLIPPMRMRCLHNFAN
jgi:hypothetical protein